MEKGVGMIRAIFGTVQDTAVFVIFCLIKYVIFEQKLVFQVDIPSFLHFGAKSTKNNEKSPISWKNSIFFYIVMSKYKLLSPNVTVHTKQQHSYQNIIFDIC